MRIDGRMLAKRLGDEIAGAIAARGRKPIVRVFVLSKDKATEQYIRIKKKAGESVGALVEDIELAPEITTGELVARIRAAVPDTDGIIVQLPLPPHIDADESLAAIPGSHDVDGIGNEATVVPPVVGAFAHILKTCGIDPAGKKVAIVGHGRLVGKPAERWFRERGSVVAIADETTIDLASVTGDADIVALGAGAGHLLKPHMIKEGAVILDAGASELAGSIVGDADPACEEKASVFTPVPGGVGPLAVMMIFKNLFDLSTGLHD